MDLAHIIEEFGAGPATALGGLVIGLLFGAAAQRSRFCLRSAVVEFARGMPGEKLVVWLLTFSTALIATQALILAGALDVSTARQLAARGSLSGAILGGALFGAGMILARGCVSRLLVLSAAGNLRALLSGLVLAVTAQASLHGALSPLRNALSGWWTVEGGSRDLLAMLGAGHAGGLAFGVLWLAAGAWFVLRLARIRPWALFGGIGVGTTIAAGWWFTWQVSDSAMAATAVPVQSLTFSGPSADMLMLVLSPPGRPLDFSIGLVPGVFLGAFVAALLAKELKLEGFRDGQSMRRYIAGAVMMGFGSMLAGGCAVGAGITGASVFAVTAWATLFSMWGAAALTDRLLDRAP